MVAIRMHMHRDHESLILPMETQISRRVEQKRAKDVEMPAVWEKSLCDRPGTGGSWPGKRRAESGERRAESRERRAESGKQKAAHGAPAAAVGHNRSDRGTGNREG
jgi:hypothetical protein